MHSWYHSLSTLLESLGFESVALNNMWRIYVTGPWEVMLLLVRPSEENRLLYVHARVRDRSLPVVGTVINTYRRAGAGLGTVKAIFRAMADPSGMPLLVGVAKAEHILACWSHDG